jgi:ATP-dependent DNA helicase RecG
VEQKSVEKSVEKIICLIKTNPYITQKELVKETRLSRHGIEKNINILKSKGILERIGPDKGGYWKIIDNQSK